MGSLQLDPVSTMQFTLSAPPITKFAPRTGTVLLKRALGLGEPPSSCPTPTPTPISIPTPNFTTSTSRGDVPHLSRDHHSQTQAIRWVNVPFESFLDRNPPILTLQHGDNPLHAFLGFNPDAHILSMTIRDPSDERDMPPNGNNHISAYCLRGVRKVSPADWRSYILACKPDIVVALPDIPLTSAPYSQKRLTKSIDRTIKWLADILRPIPRPPQTEPFSDQHVYRPNVLVHMAGGSSLAARRAFSDGLMETLHDKEAELVAPLQRLDEGVVGYTFDLVPLRLSFQAGPKKPSDDATPDDSVVNLPPPADTHTPPDDDTVLQDPAHAGIHIHVDHLIPLIQASLDSLPVSKLRTVTTAISPHEILRLIQACGIDLFDACFAQRAAQIGIALDFAFPAPSLSGGSSSAIPPRQRTNGKLDIGHNLYDSRYAVDFSCLASCFSPAFNPSQPSGSSTLPDSNTPICPCSACSPVPPKTRICHGSPAFEAESSVSDTNAYRPPYTRAYIHHLLNTHEMSAHSLLAMHNLTVLDAFFMQIRHVISTREDVSDGTSFERDVVHFFQVYDEELVLFQEATANWRVVDLARGKGRLERERKNQAVGD